MRIRSLEYSPFAYRADFVLYAGAVTALGAMLLHGAPRAEAWDLASLVLLGLALWTLIEYAMHRLLMHGVDPIRRWHAMHHGRPAALIGAPTVARGLLALTPVFLPALGLGEVWRASALTLGVLAGYLAYGLTHHAIHHGQAHSRWLRSRHHWHTLHHQPGRPVCYGVTSGFWDRVFGTSAPSTLRDSGALQDRAHRTPGSRDASDRPSSAVAARQRRPR
jgi:cyclopropane-fatty-acyl-phospholipid synthase